MKLIQNLLIDILQNSPSANKYSKAYLNLKNVIELQSDNKELASETVLDMFSKLNSQYNTFINNIPLMVVERYYGQFSQDYDKYVFLEYNGNEIAEMKIIDLYLILEEFFEECFRLACEIADEYNLEVKLKSKNNTESNDFF